MRDPCGAMKLTTKRVLGRPVEGLIVIRGFPVACAFVAPELAILEAAEHAGTAAIPTTINEAATFGLMTPGSLPMARHPNPRYIYASQGD